MANINETISEVEKLNPELARQIQKYVKDHSYGLVFEHNLPEVVRLYKKSPSIGDTVNILPMRGYEENKENKIPWVVMAIDNDKALIGHDTENKEVSVENIVPVVSYRDVIYPGMKELDRIERGNPNDPYHMVIQAENYHALEALTYAYAGKVDCIYIDPPYNNRIRSWKYNNDYVEPDDQYRHSKWLAFMERRLKLAKQLLNPNASALIVTIDEKEYLRLGLLLEQTFPEANIQMVSSVINHASVARFNEFNRNNEYIYFVLIGDYKLESLDDSKTAVAGQEVSWNTLRRHSPSNVRASRPRQFYPIYINIDNHKIEEIGDPITPDVDRFSVKQRPGCVAVFPVRDNGTEMLWGVIPSELKRRVKGGYVRVGKYEPNKPQQFGIQVLPSGPIKEIEEGTLKISGYREDGSVIVVREETKLVLPKTQWDYATHDSKNYGSNILKNIFHDARFEYPKSLYAVEDCLKIVIGEKKDALVVDFFAGSGTTLHAVNLLNAEDGGHRRCICVTNNEVSADEQRQFVCSCLRPGDTDWEKYGIANYVTWPRTKCSIEGKDINGGSLDGNYGQPAKDIDFGYDLPMSEGFKANAIFCELTYESAWPIRLDRAFDAIAPILWMQAGCRGPIIRRIGKSYLTTDYYGVLFDYNQSSKFCEKVKSTPSIKTVFVVTDDQRRYSNICKRLPNIDVHRLYETFLRTFEICGEGGLD